MSLFALSPILCIRMIPMTVCWGKSYSPKMMFCRIPRACRCCSGLLAQWYAQTNSHSFQCRGRKISRHVHTYTKHWFGYMGRANKLVRSSNVSDQISAFGHAKTIENMDSSRCSTVSAIGLMCLCACVCVDRYPSKQFVS